MASTVTIEEGDIVRTIDGFDGVVLRNIETGYGGRESVVMLLECKQTQVYNWFELTVLSKLDDEIPWEDLEPVEDNVSLPTIEPVKGRFAKVTSEKDIDNLVEGRLSKGTKRQNNWAVRVFKGKNYFDIYLYFAREAKPRPLQSRRAVNHVPESDEREETLLSVTPQNRGMRRKSGGTPKSTVSCRKHLKFVHVCS